MTLNHLNPLSVSVIATVKNEGNALKPLLESLLDQSRQPDEIVFCDAGSTDETVAIIDSYKPFLPIKLLVKEGANISAGRNAAIEAASGEIIAATDAGVTLSPNWLEELAAPIEQDGMEVVSGWFEADPYTDFEVALGATVLPAINDIKPDTFLPSSRSVAFLKSAWQQAGGYPEWLDFSEDLIFDLALRESYGAFPFAGKAVAYYRPRHNLRAFAKQYYLYARGDGKANLWGKRHLIRYVTYFAGIPLIARAIWRGKYWGWAALGLGGAAYSRRPAQRLWGATRGWTLPARARAFALIPLIRFVGDAAKMVGYPVGVWWRWRNQQRTNQR